MKNLLSFVFFVSTIAFVIVFAGCESSSPICSTNFCLTGEIFPRSELADDAVFSEVDVDDSVILATLVSVPTPVEVVPETVVEIPSVTLADIVNDVASGGTNYTGEIVTIVAPVEVDASEFTDNDAITLASGNENVWFFIFSRETPARLANYEAGKTYTFNLFINQIDPPDQFSSQYVIVSNIPTDRVSINLETLISNVAMGNRDYIDKVVILTATVRSDQTIFDPSDTITLVTNNDNISFFVSNRTENVSLLKRYNKGETYQFTVFIRDIKPNPSGNRLHIWSHIVID